MNGQKFLSQIKMLVAPTADEHVVRLGDVRAMLEAHVKTPVRVATTANLAAVYDAGNMTLTASADGVLTVDGLSPEAGNRILVKDQTDKTQNGIYIVTGPGSAGDPYVLTRAGDFDRSEELLEGVRIAVAAGTSGKGVWYLSSQAPLTLDTSNLEFVRDTATSVAVKASYAITGDGTETDFDFTHSWGTKDITWALYDAATDEAVMAEFKCMSVNGVRVTFAAAPAVSENYRLVVMAVTTE
jgi:hypothetical protein